jgi:hypothetical protein
LNCSTNFILIQATIARLGGFCLLLLSPNLKSQPNHSDVADDGGYILCRAQDQTRTFGACDSRALARRTTGPVWDSFVGPYFDSKLAFPLSWLRLESKQQKAWCLGAGFHGEVGGGGELMSTSGHRIQACSSCREEQSSKVVLITERGTAVGEEGARRGGRSRRWRGVVATGGETIAGSGRAPHRIRSRSSPKVMLVA